MKSLKIDIYSDVVCPWCYLGQKRLQLALEGLSDKIAAEIEWRPFQLDPNVPEEGYDTFDYLARKIGGRDQVSRSHAMLKSLGEEIGLPFELEKAKVFPNTFAAHRLLHLAGQEGAAVQDKVAQALFRANFVEGRNVADRDVLLAIAADAGLPGDRVSAYLDSDEDVAELKADMDRAHSLGITGVPFFVVDGKYAISGAQNVEVFANALNQIADMK